MRTATFTASNLDSFRLSAYVRIAIAAFALLLSASTANSRAAEVSLAKGIEHFNIASDDAKAMFELFRDQLQLPVVYGFQENPAYASAGVWAGNVMIEFIKYGRKDNTLQPTRFSAIAFEPVATAEKTAKELARRGVAITGVYPAKIMWDGKEILPWINVPLKDFLPTRNRFFFFDVLLPVDNPILAKLPAQAQFAKTGGGPLGVVEVKEMAIGVADLNVAREQWRRVFGEPAKGSEDLFEFSVGPRVRLVASDSPGVKSISIRVRSLAKAEAALRALKLFAVDALGRPVLLLEKFGGISILVVKD